MISLQTLFFQSWKSIRARPSRSLLTVLGIVIGVAGVIIIISLGAGAQALIVGQVTKLGSNLIAVFPGKTDEAGPPAAVFGAEITTLNMRDVVALQDKNEVPYITAVTTAVRGNGTVVYRDKNIDTAYTGTTGTYPEVLTLPMAQGEFFSVAEGEAGAQVAVLGYDVNELLFGSEDSIGKVIKVGTVQLRVIGVAAKKGTVFFQNYDDQIYLPLPIAQKQLLGIDHLQFIQAKVANAEVVKDTIEQVKGVLTRTHRIRSAESIDFSVRDLADAVKILTGITNALRLFLVVMAGVSLLVGGIGIMNIMLVTVSERTREIGLRKALGATPRDIRTQFLVEAIAITSIGGVIGIIFGTFISFLIAQGARFAGFDWVFIVSPVAILLALLVSIATGIIFGLSPARTAAKLDPIEALRYE